MLAEAKREAERIVREARVQQARLISDEEVTKQAERAADERKAFIEEATTSLDNVEVQTFSNLLVEFARELDAVAIVKGLRAISDFEYEFEMAQLNRKLDPDMESIYMIASPQYSFLSSTGVKEMATFKGDVSDLVPDPVARAMADRLGER